MTKPQLASSARTDQPLAPQATRPGRARACTAHPAGICDRRPPGDISLRTPTHALYLVLASTLLVSCDRNIRSVTRRARSRHGLPMAPRPAAVTTPRPPRSRATTCMRCSRPGCTAAATCASHGRRRSSSGAQDRHDAGQQLADDADPGRRHAVRLQRLQPRVRARSRRPAPRSGATTRGVDVDQGDRWSTAAASAAGRRPAPRARPATTASSWARSMPA